MNTREAALKTLYEIEYNGAFSNIAVKNMLKNQSMTMQEKGFYTRLVYGTLDKKITLDYIIEKFSKIKLKKAFKIYTSYFKDGDISAQIYGLRT